MYKIPLEKMVCDSDRGDGGIYFYEEYFEWLERDKGTGFRIWYKSIKDVKVVMTQKKKVIILTQQGQSVNLYLYKYEELLKILYERMNASKEAPIDAEVSKPEAKDDGDDLSKLERLAKLHESGALTDEEFAQAKKKILGQKKTVAMLLFFFDCYNLLIVLTTLLGWP